MPDRPVDHRAHERVSSLQSATGRRLDAMSVTHYSHAVANLEHLFEMVADEDDADPCRLEPVDGGYENANLVAVSVAVGSSRR